MKSKKQRFYSILKDLFVGAKLEGKSGYVNLMNTKSSYFDKISKLIQDKIKQEVNEDERDELYDKLYTFFDDYFSDGGSIFFSSTPVYKNIYAKVYSDREDTALFWKTKDLYYVKTEVNYQSVKNLKLNEDDIFTFDFDASDLEHKKSNEKKELAFYFTGLKKDNNKFNLKFKVKYKETNSYDRLKEILKINDTNKLKSYIFENFEEIDNSFIFIEKNDIDLSKVNFKSKSKSNIKADILITNQNDVVNSVKLEPVITDIEEIIKYCKKEGLVILKEEDILKAFRIYKRQNEIDYFIHKDARAFLKEQFDLYVYQYLANDLDTIFNQERLDTIRKIKEIAYFVIDLIGKFEDEVKKIWLKPKFVLNSNYVITIDRIVEKENSLTLVKKIFESEGIDEQIKEWKELGIVDDDFNKEEVFGNGLIKGLNGKYKHLPIDTKYFDKDIKYEILSLFDNLDDELDGWLIKSDNFQALNTILPKFKEKVQTIYIDPPYNTGSDEFIYKDSFRHASWLTMLLNRLTLAKGFLKDSGNICVSINEDELYNLKHVMDYVFDSRNYIANLSVKVRHEQRILKGDKDIHEVIEYLLYYRKSETHKIRKIKSKQDSIKEYVWKIEEREEPSSIVEIGGKKVEIFEPGQFKLVKISPNEKLLKRINIRGSIKQGNSSGRFYTNYLEPNFDEYRGHLLKVYGIGGDNLGYRYFYIPDITSKRKNGDYFQGMPIIEDKSKELPLPNFLDMVEEFNRTGYEGYKYFGNGKKPESFLCKVNYISNNKKGDFVMDFFLGSGTTTATMQKIERKWIGVEMADYFYFTILPRMKEVLSGKGNHEPCGISKKVNWQGGGFFKYYELEQFEDVLRKAVYKPTSDKLENIEFNLSPKLAEEGLEIDYEKESAKYTFEKLYPDVDIPETISNLIGKKIKKITKDKVIFEDNFEEDNFEVDLNNLTFEKYSFLKPLIWWE